MRSIISQFSKSRASSLLFAGVLITPLFVLSVVLSPKLARAQVVPPAAPTLISITEGSKFTKPQPVVTGLTLNSTQVNVLIDNKFEGSATVRNHESGTANFFYYPKTLKPGNHTLTAIAAKDANVSPEVTVNFEIVGFVPPTLLDSVFNLETTEARPFIVGVARNNSRVQIYLDDKFAGEVIVKNHVSGVGSFRYKPQSDLAVGMHQAYAFATNRLTGQESLKSKLLTFEVKAPYPAPTLFQPQASQASWSRPIISGVAKNGSRVDVYINNVKYPVHLKDHPSGTTYFTYQPEVALPSSKNVIFAVVYSHQGRMSSKSNLVYWDLSPIRPGRTAAPTAKAEEPLVPSRPEVKPGVPTDKTARVEETGETPDIEIDLEDQAGKADITVKDEEEKTTEEATTTEGEKGTGPNWSKIIGLIILAILIIALIVQLLKKEKPEEKKGETLDLFESGKKDEDKKEGTRQKKSEKSNESSKSESQENDIPPPPPPSSNLPF